MSTPNHAENSAPAKVVLVTGGNGGQGLSLATLLSRSGYHVVLTDLDDEAAASVRDEASIDYYQLDVGDEQAWLAVRDEVLRRHGRLDGLVNNAGTFRVSPISETTVEEAEALHRVNQLGPILGIKTFADALAAARGSVVNVASTAGIRGYPDRIAYTGTKWAIRGISRAAATELAPRGVRVNCITPGLIDTPMARKNDPEQLAAFIAGLPFGRPGTPDEVGGATLFLLSEAASYISGAELVVDGAATTT